MINSLLLALPRLGPAGAQEWETGAAGQPSVCRFWDAVRLLPSAKSEDLFSIGPQICRPSVSKVWGRLASRQFFVHQPLLDIGGL